MTKFTIDIVDAAKLAGITAAREAKNAALVAEEGKTREDHPDYIATDAAYVQFVMDGAAESYAKQYGLME